MSIVAATGNVGIGTVGPVTQLDIDGKAVGVPSGTYATSIANSKMVINAAGTGTGLQFGIGSGNYAWLQAQNTDSTEKILALNPVGGAVGIGTTSPSSIVEIEGNAPSLAITEDSSNNAAGTDLAMLDFGDGYSDAQGRILVERDATGSGGDNPTRMSFWTTPDASTTLTQRMTIDDAGNVGIGDPTPSYTLDVAGTGYFSGDVGIGIIPGGAGYELDVVGKVRVSSSILSPDFFMNVYSQVGNDPMCWDGSSGSFMGDCTSLRKYKNTIQDFPLGIDELMLIQPRTFNWNSGRMNDSGFIAEEISEVSSWFGNYRDGNLSGVNTNALNALFVESIQEQQFMIGNNTFDIKNLNLNISEMNLDFKNIKLNLSNIGMDMEELNISISKFGLKMDENTFEITQLKLENEELKFEVESLDNSLTTLQSELCSQDNSYSWC